MKLVRKVRLSFQEDKSDKVYEVDLVELSSADNNRYLVNFRFGRRGRELREGTKTASPVALAEAEALYQSVVVSKTNKGYRDEGDSSPRPSAMPRVSSNTSSVGQQEARFAALIKALTNETDSKKRARIIWNLGNSTLSEHTAATAIKAVTAHVKHGDWREDYSIAWTLGRWRYSTTVATLEQLQRHSDNHVKDMAFEALLLVVTPSRAAELLRAERDELPVPLRTAIEQSNEAEIIRTMQALVDECPASLNRTLTICYRVAIIVPVVHRALLAILTACPLQPGIFKAVRHIFKMAEMRVDHEVLACLTHRVETTQAFFRCNWDWAYIPGQGSINAAKELPKDNSRLAYSHRTRNYLRKRAWRVLNRLARADSDHYVPLAKAVLLRVSDGDTVKPRTSEVYRWTSDERRPRRQLVSKKEFDEFAHLLTFNHILRGANPAFKLTSSGTAWYRSGGNDSPIRGERYSHLWDQNPSAALDLLRRSHCALVHDGAIRILAPHADFLNSLSSNEIAELLQSPYLQTARFALPLAEASFARGAGDDALLLALLKSQLPEANNLGIRILAAQSEFIQNQTLVIELLLVFQGPLPALVRDALSRHEFTEGTQQQIVTGVITNLLARNIDLDASNAEALAQLLIERFPLAVPQLPLTLVDRLLSHMELGKQLLGARLLVANSVDFKSIPERLLQHIHSSVHEQVRAIAVALLSKQSLDELLAQAPMLAELYYRGAAAERREYLGVLARLADSSLNNQAQILHVMLGLLFRAEHEQGQGDELLGFFQKHLHSAAHSLDKDTLWRLLQAQSNTAQRVGSKLLDQRPAADFSVRQWAKLAQHDDLSTRRYAMTAYTAHIDLVKQHTRDALRLLDSQWDDVRAFGFRYFREQYIDSDWSPEYIVGICDSTQHDVQNFGRELLQRSFQQQQGPQYLASLSEHPSVNVQLFVSHFLEAHAAGHVDRILSLRDFFITVLSHINKARICKDRVMQFLLQEALQDQQVAAMAAEIFTRVSLTVVSKDRSQLIKAMIALRSAFPQLTLPLKAEPLRAKHMEVSGGV